MRKALTIALAGAALLGAGHGAFAQDATDTSRAPVGRGAVAAIGAPPPTRVTTGPGPALKRAPRVRVASAPTRYVLSGVPWERQGLNNCGPVTTNMVLGYYGVHLSQAYTEGRLKPNPADVAVGAVEMVTFAQLEYGYGGEVGWGGNMRLLETFIANGIPVTVLQPLHPTSDINHFRVVYGYDREDRTVRVNDSLLGRGLVWSYDYFEGLWRQRGYSYNLIYPRRDQALAEAITLRYRANDERRRREGLQRSRRYVEENPSDPWGWLQHGQTLYHRERYGESLRAWERANALGLPARALWYVSWPAALMNALGRHAEARDMASGAIANNPGSSEMYYERARAYHELGEPGLARENLRLAREFAPYHPRFRETYARYTGRAWIEIEMNGVVPSHDSGRP
jgi:hypothetical protein